MARRGHDTRERIRHYLLQCQSQGEIPTVREMGHALGLRSPATVQQHLRALEEDGVITRSGAGRSRAWRVVQAPTLRTRHTIPVVGRIAAGQPIESLPEDENPLPISPRSFAASGEVVALRVEGDSMIEVGILPGDFAIVRRQPRVENGEVAAVLVNGEGTLKRWRQKGSTRAALEPANRRFAAISLSRGSGDVSVYGKLVGVIRRM